MDLQELVERLMTQHRLAYARLLGELHVAYDEAVAVLADRFPDPRQIPGGTLCGMVRAFVLDMNGLDALSGTRNQPRSAPRGASGGPDSTLAVTSGPNSSVRLHDSLLTEHRVRKLAARKVKALETLGPQRGSGPRPGTQMVLDEGLAARVLGPAGQGEQFDLFIYWWPTPDRVSVADAILAAVADIDTSEERILAFTAMPPAVRPRSAAEIQTQDYEPVDDFDEYDQGAGTGDSEA